MKKCNSKNEKNLKKFIYIFSQFIRDECLSKLNISK